MTLTQSDKATQTHSVFQQVTDNEAARQACARALVDAIKAANAEAPESWSIGYVGGDMIRLNVGPVEVLVLRPGDTRLVVLEAPGVADVASLGDIVAVSEPGYHYVSMPVVHRIIETGTDAIPTVYEHVRVPFLDYVRAAARRRKKSSWWRNCKPEIIHYLRHYLGEDVPLPGYPLGDPFGVLKRDLFYEQYDRFLTHIERKGGGSEFLSFADNAYIQEQEGYKDSVWTEARSKLALDQWQSDDVGTGIIAERVVAAIELKQNNLVHWRAKRGPQSRAHAKMLDIARQPGRRVDLEQSLFELYRKNDDGAAFEALRKLIGNRYDLMAYLLFLKDKDRYLPISTTNFDRVFERFGADLKTQGHCSWDNYQSYLRLIGQVRDALSAELSEPVSLLDAHSFCWMLAFQVERDEQSLADRLDDDPSLSPRDRQAVIRARVGQGRFRALVVDYWQGVCAVTGCANNTLLIASHIKPWRVCTAAESIDRFNGLLLSPTLDAAFDVGLITFGDDGAIRVSRRFAEADLKALRIDTDMRLKRLPSREQQVYLDYHRRNIFQA